MSIIEPPVSCRKCSFFQKCFGESDILEADRPYVRREEWISYPLAVGDVTTRVIACGLKGPPVVMVHGPGGSAEQWAYNLNALARAGYRAYAIDLPGHGFASKSTAGVHSAGDYANFLADFLRELPEPAALVGFSLGGHAAAQCVADNPELVSALALVAATGGVALGADLRQKLQRMLIYRSRDGGLERLRRMFFDPRLATDELAEQSFKINNSPGAAVSLRSLGTYLSTGIDDDVLGDRLAGVATRKPVLFVWGAHDTVLPLEFGRRSHSVAGGGSGFIVVENAGHAPHFEQPAVFNRSLHAFLSTQQGIQPTSTAKRAAPLIL